MNCINLFNISFEHPLQLKISVGGRSKEANKADTVTAPESSTTGVDIGVQPLPR